MAVRGSTLTGNSAFAGVPGASATGGAIYNNGTLTLDRSRARDNAVTSSGSGGTAEGGGLFNDTSGTASLTASVVIRNRATGGNASGGGIFDANPTSGSVALRMTAVDANAPNNCTPTIGRCS